MKIEIKEAKGEGRGRGRREKGTGTRTEGKGYGNKDGGKGVCMVTGTERWNGGGVQGTGLDGGGREMTDEFRYWDGENGRGRRRGGERSAV